MALTSDEYLQQQCDAMNGAAGKLGGYDCPICHNKGFVYYPHNGEMMCRECDCKPMRDSLIKLASSGIQNTMERYTFDRYIVTEPWQQTIKSSVMDFAANPGNNWLMMGGQVGCGKTHLCTAALNEFLKSGKSVRYMLWRDDVVKIKSCVNDDAAYSRLMTSLKEVDVLYIDDFFKTQSGAAPTSADVNVAFEIINSRYCNLKRTTILSCEMDIDGIMRIDEAVGSRIYERTKEKDYAIIIGKDQTKNYRLK